MIATVLVIMSVTVAGQLAVPWRCERSDVTFYVFVIDDVEDQALDTVQIFDFMFMFAVEAGDLIATGTPAGVGLLCAGDVVESVVEGVGRLTNPVRAEGE